ncbi:hypothetical protein BN3661_01993 [Eubacteriaceae bacterium CHKCI005]|nr:hypothetical protein BN3661_01993 [Eubacteriaceae bacterium CHKCI005]
MRGQNKTWWKVLLGIIGACILLVIGWVVAPIGILIYWLWCRKNQRNLDKKILGAGAAVFVVSLVIFIGVMTDNKVEPASTVPESSMSSEIVSSEASSKVSGQITESSVSKKSEFGTSAKVDEIALKAKEDAETATDEELQEALTWLQENTTSYFQGSDNMEKTMYYGELLNYKYKDTGNAYEKIGWQAFKTVKYVYRGEETVMDDNTHDNLLELKEMLDECDPIVQQEAPSETPVEEEPVAPSKAPAKVESKSPSKAPETEVVDEPEKNTTYVLNTNTKKFHFSSCKEVKKIKPENYSETNSRESAINSGYVPCKKCNP